MKKLPSYIIIIALLVMNFAGVVHASCADGNLCSDSPPVGSTDNVSDTNQNDDQQRASCDCCAASHHQLYTSSSNGISTHFAEASTKHHNWGGESYFSQLNYPPSKPPKA